MDTLRQENFQQKMSSTNTAHEKQSVSEEAELLFKKGEEQRKDLNNKI